MTTLVTAISTDFTPSAGDFTVQVNGGAAILRSKNPGAAQFADAALVDRRMTISNPVASTVYRFETVAGYPTPTLVQADQ